MSMGGGSIIVNFTYYSQSDGIKNMVRMLYEGKLVPIIGSGFTQKCQSSGAKVPNGDCATKLMKELIAKYKKLDLSTADFNKTAERFFAVVPKKDQWNFFQKYFTGVDISGYRQDFINLPWPYIYTLNIDDGIEANSLYKTVLPYQNAKVPNSAIKTLYKLHGDANYEVLHEVKDNIVFSVNQYIELLTSESNTTLINSITGDYKQNNLLFIGCSLINEPDLKYIFSKSRAEVPKNNLRCVLRTEKPNEDDEYNLQAYGINSAIIVSDYELFYRAFVSEFSQLQAQHVSSNYAFTNPSHISVSENKENTIYYFSGQNIFNKAKNAFYQSGMQTPRSCLQNIETQLESDNSVIIRGRRFSGKTYVLSSLAERFSKYTILYFPSEAGLDEDVLCCLFKTNTYSLFLFDSNSLTNYAYHFVANSEKLLQTNHNKLVIAVNSNDNYLSDALDTEVINIPAIFNIDELNILNPLSDKYGLIRRKIKTTNIDYLKQLSDEQKIDFSIFGKLPKQYTQQELVILVLLCVEDKLYFSDINALSIRFHEVDNLISRLSGIIEKVPTSKNEKSHHATEKLVHNSKYVLLSIMKNLTSDEIVNTIVYIVSHFVNDKSRRRLYVQTVFFDTLNQLFGFEKGAGKLIFKIYNSLEVYLNQDMDYWLQRAKSIYRILPSSQKDLLNAYQYAKKSLGDGNLRLQAKSALTTSLICCLLSKTYDGERQNDFEVEAINCADVAISSDYFHTKQGNLKGELGIERRKSYSQLILAVCNKHLDPQVDLKTAWKSINIKKQLEDIHNSVKHYRG